MDVTEFIAANSVIVLPSRNNPKVYLALDSPRIVRLSFQLYNPFSKWGKLLKNVIRFACIYLNTTVKLLLPRAKACKSMFVTYLENELGAPLTTSVYCATAKDKVVLQIIKDDQIYGYLKFPKNGKGVERLLNERRAIQVLSKLGLVPSLRFYGSYNELPFIILKNLEGVIGEVERSEYLSVLSRFKKPIVHKLNEHPRVISILEDLKKYDVNEFGQYFQNEINNCDCYVSEVYEHGDFAPWNLIQTPGGLLPFDFEYFVKEGIEYFDELKYHFQIAHLLEGKSGRLLIDTIRSRVNIVQFSILFRLFLFKEILLKKQEGRLFSLETTLLGCMHNEKA